MKELLGAGAAQQKDQDGCMPEDLARELDDSEALHILMTTSMHHTEGSTLPSLPAESKVLPDIGHPRPPDILIPEDKP